MKKKKMIRALNRLIICIPVLMLLGGCAGGSSGNSNTDTDTTTDSVTEQAAPYEGYNLFSALNSTTAYLMDNDGNYVHSWDTGYPPGNAMYLLENGELLHTGKIDNQAFDQGGAGGVVQMIDWNGNLTWEYQYSSDSHLQHHDVEMLPNGNVLMIAWQYRSATEAVAAGRDPSLLSDGELWPDSIIEVQPTGTNTGRIVWQWYVWDHLVQEYDAGKANYGVVAEHPELIDLNHVMNNGADWNHTNSVDYSEELDQIVLSVHNFSEIWVIDHSTTTAEAAGRSGGNSGMGGDLLYRWGNPRTYGAGTAADQQLFAQHDAEWILTGDPGAGNIIIFNNGSGRPEGNYSSIEEIAPPLKTDGTYSLTSGSAYGPAWPVWNYTATIPTDFFARNISGQQRLNNGNTLICDGPDGYFFEVTGSGDTVWEHTTTGAVFRVERYSPEFQGFDGTPLDDDPTSRPPVADAGRAYGGDVGSIITLDGTGSSDPDGWIASYDWDLDNDGWHDDASGVMADFIAATAGTFTVSLQVIDNDGLTGTDRATVIVGEDDIMTLSYPIVDTRQATCYDEAFALNSCPGEWDAFYGQDAQYDGTQPGYTDNGDGTVTDNKTGLMWQQDPGAKMTYDEALAGAGSFSLAGYDDWRLPTIKELYSLILFSGTDPNAESTDTSGLIPFIDTDYFMFEYGDTSSGDRIIDSQFASATRYVSTTMNGSETVFGVNFADGRIKGYGTSNPRGFEKEFHILHVRGNEDYGVNDFIDNNDGTVTDTATGLMWMQDDSGSFGAGDFNDGALNWEQALAWCEDLDYAGYSDWRLPDAKELQSIVDYTRSPDTTGSAAIDPLFNTTRIINEKGEQDYAHYWTSTSHAKTDGPVEAAGVYIAFGRAMGYMGEWLDVHGAGAQRSDPKSGDPEDYPQGRGPQGDAVRIYNYVRCVR